MLHYDGTSWSSVYLQAAGNHFRRVWGTDANNVWVVGSSNIIFRKRGTSWTYSDANTGLPASVTATTYRAVWGTDPNNIWVVGEGGVIMHFDGNAWAEQPKLVTQDLLDIWGSAANDVWASGAFTQTSSPGSAPATLLHFDGVSWKQRQNNIAGFGALHGIFGTSAQNYVAVGEMSQIVRWDGSTWRVSPYSPAPPLYMRNLYSVWGFDANTLFAVGDVGTVLRWNGSTWTAQANSLRVHLKDVWGSDPCNLWAVGAVGQLMRYQP